MLRNATGLCLTTYLVTALNAKQLKLLSQTRTGHFVTCPFSRELQRETLPPFSWLSGVLPRGYLGAEDLKLSEFKSRLYLGLQTCSPGVSPTSQRGAVFAPHPGQVNRLQVLTLTLQRSVLKTLVNSIGC